MNYLLPGMEIALILVQVYQFHETMICGYRSLYTRIQKFLLLYVVIFLASIIFDAFFYHIALMIMIIAAAFIYRKEEDIVRTSGLFILTYVIGIFAYQIVGVYMGSKDILMSYAFSDDLFIFGSAYLCQLAICSHSLKRYDQMYVYPVAFSIMAYLLILTYFTHHQYMEHDVILMASQLLLLLVSSFYRICFCMEVSKEKEILALEKAHTMVGNKERYEAIQKENEFIMKNMHDLKKHLDMLDQMGSENEKIEHYRNEIYEKSEELLHYQKTGDVLIDKVLQLYHPKFKDANIQCNIESEDIHYDFMDAVDLCAVLCNMLDNAYESCMKCEQRFILLRMRNINGKIIWKMKNSTMEKEVIKGSSKPDRFAHGFGMQNIEGIAKKYHGELLCEIDEIHGIFTTAVSFMNTDDVEN